MNNCGFLLISTGEVYLRAANMLARSIRDHHPKVQIDLFCDSREFVDETQFDRIEIIENPHRRSKVDCLARSRFRPNHLSRFRHPAL